MVEFAHFTKDEEVAVQIIINRALAFYTSLGIFRDEIDVRMDLSAVHASSPLRLQDMAEAEIENLMHDVSGIGRHLDRGTGKLTGCFLPRFTRSGGVQ